MFQIKKIITNIKSHPPRLILTSFVFVIFLGALLLSMPFSLVDGNQINYVDALFTSTSATCVTGLIVVDTGSYFSIYGQIIILFLIQIGGLGVMTFSTLFLFYIRGRFGIGGRDIMQETISTFDIIDIGSLLKSVFLFTFSVEATGLFLLFTRFIFDMPFGEAFFNALFHSISAFCNAGFSTFNNSLINYRSDLFVNFIIMFLIVSGGIGFIVIHELIVNRKKKISFYNLSLHSKIVLSGSAVLIISGAVLLFLLEYNVSMKDYGIPTKLLSSLFQSVTARTAGFNTIDLFNFSVPSIFIIVTLMFIGASPASCGGGIKTSTIAVIIAYIKSRINDQKNVNLYYHTIPFSVISKAIIVLVFGVITVMLFSLLVTMIELGHNSFFVNGTKFIQVFFEIVSAFGTVGLSTGITSDLSTLSRILIILLMLIGRVGPLTLALSVGSKESVDIKYAEENILIG